MGNFYTNYTVYGQSQQAVIAALKGRTAYVTPVQHGCVVVFDEESEGQNEVVVTALADHLSGFLMCPVLALINHDDDILWYQLLVNGEVIDEYDSCPEYFDETAEPSDPVGGDAQKVCRAFESSNVAEVERVLRVSSLDDDGYAFEIERHTDLVKALGIAAYGVGMGFSYIEAGELPLGLAKTDLVRVP